MTRCNLWLAAMVAFLIVPIVRGDDQDARKRISKMTKTEKDQLIRQRQRFAKMTSTERQRLRKLHKQISSHPDSKKLKRVMHRYYDWLKSLRSSTRAELRDLPKQKRIARIREIMRKQELDRFQRLANDQLPKSDLDWIFKWVQQYVKRHQDELMRRWAGDFRTKQRMKRVPPERRTRVLIMFMMRNWNRSKGNVRLRLNLREVEEIRDKLSAEAIRRLDEYDSMPMRQRAMIQRWIRAAIVSRMVPYPSRRDLQKFYLSELNDGDRERLDSLQPDRMGRELRRLYYSYRMSKLNGQKKVRRPMRPRDRGSRPFRRRESP